MSLMRVNAVANRRFWNTVKLFLLDKTKKQGKITLVEKDEIVPDDKKLYKIFKEMFANAAPNLNIPEFTVNFDLNNKCYFKI